MKNITVLSIAASLIVSANVAHAIVPVYPYEYDFVQTGGDGTFSGALFLDASSGVNGTSFDIGPGSYLDTPDGDFTLGNGSGQPSWTVSALSWNYIDIYSIQLSGNYYSEEFTISTGSTFESIEEHTPTVDPTGYGIFVAANLVSSIPDGASTALLLGVASGAMGLARRRFGRKA